MQVIFSTVVILLVSGIALAQLDEVDVIRSEMEQSMEKYAVGSALVLLSSEIDIAVVAKKLVDLMNTKYGNEWVTLIGTNLHTTIIGMQMVDKTMLLMEYKNNHVLLVRQQVSQVQNNRTNLETIIERAKTAPVQRISTSNPKNFDRFTSVAKQVISTVDKTCDKNTSSTDIKKWCYRLMSQSMVDAINNMNGTLDTYSATIGDNNRCFSETLGLNITEAHLFTLADIYFEITGYTG